MSIAEVNLGATNSQNKNQSEALSVLVYPWWG